VRAVIHVVGVWFVEVWRWLGPLLIGLTVASAPRRCPSPCCSYEVDTEPEWPTADPDRQLAVVGS
jgi:hypothetical protein